MSASEERHSAAPVDDSHTFFWLVGVLEGEGYFGYNGKSPRVEVEMKDEQVIARIAALFDRNYYRRDRRAAKPGTAVTYRVAITGIYALRLMKRVQPYMSPRRQRAIQDVEEKYCEEHPRNVEYTRIPLPPLTELPYSIVSQQ